MRKKKLLILSILMVVFSLGTWNVKAATAFYKGEQFTEKLLEKYYKYNMAIYDSQLNKNVYDNGVMTRVYGFNDPSGDQYIGYCADPGSSAASNYKLERFLGDKSNSLTTQAHDIGLLEIMKTGYNSYNNSFTADGVELSGYDLYTATNIAIRAYTLGLFDYTQVKNLKSDYQKYYLVANMKVGLQWTSYIRDKASVFLTGYNCSTSLSSSEYQKCITKGFTTKHSWYNAKYSFTYSSSDTDALAIINGAKQLFYIGVNKAYEVYTGATTNATIEAKDNGVIEKETSGETITEYYGATISFENFNAKKTDKKDIGKIYDIKLNVSNATNMTIGPLQWKNPATNSWEDLSSQTNVIEIFASLNSGAEKVSGEIQLRFKVTKSKDEEKCKPANYEISYKYNDPSLEYIGAKLTAGDSAYQRMFVIQKNEGDLTDSLNGTIKCESSCETEITKPDCYGDAIGTVKTDDKTKSCIIDNQDDAGNTYQFTENVGGVSNAYCSVYCKEDYAEIRLQPLIENVTCGDYIKLTSHIDGTKSCYTGGDTDETARYGEKSINKDLYIEHVHSYQELMVDGYNQWISGKTAEPLPIVEEKYDCDGTTVYTYYVKEISYIGKKLVTIDEYEGEYKPENETKTSWYSSYRSDGSYYFKKEEVNGKEIEVCIVTDANTNGKDKVKKAIQNDITSGSGKMQSGYTNYKNANNDYNSCTTVWTNKFKFEQQIEYYYDETHADEEQYTPYFDLIKGKDEAIHLEKDGQGTEEGHIYVWVNQGVSNKINEEEDTGYEPFDISIDSGSLGKFKYNSSYEDVFEERTYAICIPKGDGYECKIDDVDGKTYISQASFIKKTVRKTQDYITPTSFYQIEASGKITTIEYTGKEIKVQALENQLPLSGQLVGGGAFQLKLQDLGEFYDSDELGRIFDVEGEHENESVANALKAGGTFDGNYYCEYASLCRPKDCPNCDFSCDEGSCEFTPCPNCDFTCLNCIFNLDELNFNVSTITTTKVQSVDRTYGYNWITSSTLGELSLLTQKASKTIEEIEDLNEMVYNAEKNADGESSLGFSIVLNSSMISDIKKYNKEQESNGGYINDSLSCYDATVNGTTYKNIYCYSDFIDELYSKYDDAITVSDKRINDEDMRENGTQSSGYWTLYDTSDVLGDWHETNLIGGPSWK